MKVSFTWKQIPQRLRWNYRSVKESQSDTDRDPLQVYDNLRIRRFSYLLLLPCLDPMGNPSNGSITRIPKKKLVSLENVNLDP